MSDTLPVMEQFHTIQGEGFHQGRAAYFIRLGGCDVGCVWCDVKDSWDKDAHPQHSINSLVENAKQYPSDIVVITGGEPLMHDLTSLTRALHEAGLRTHLETSGTHPLTGEWDWITFSPKKFKLPLPEVADKADELKVVVFHKSDVAFAELHAATVGKQCLLFLQPEWDNRETMMPLITAYVQAHPQWRVSLQTHKYLQIP